MRQLQKCFRLFSYQVSYLVNYPFSNLVI